MPTTLLLIRICCNLEGLLIMVQINTIMSLVDLGLWTKKFLFWSYMTNLALVIYAYVIYDQLGTTMTVLLVVCLSNSWQYFFSFYSNVGSHYRGRCKGQT